MDVTVNINPWLAAALFVAVCWIVNRLTNRRS